MAAATKLVITNPVGLHARPASIFVQTATQFASDIQITNVTGGKGPVNAKSILSILTLGVEKDFEVEISAVGQDEQDAVEALSALIRDNFGEG